MSVIDMHLHIKYRSRCSNLSLDDLYNNISDRFDAVCITDHWKINPLLYNPFVDKPLFLGVEVTSTMGDILAYGVRSVPLKNKHLLAENLIDYIHRQGGIAVCAHPFSNRHDGFEDHVYAYDFDAIEINGALDKKYHKMAESAANEMDVALIGGSDAHSISQLNTIGTQFDIPINSIEDIIKTVKNKMCNPIRII